ncbi:MAG: MotA/TolQ/ExbB proton channel family protein [Myxococcales bacterium]|nr:MotA/TolQ/ExbB proton channel family protein [Myxococcales bacterium]
MKMELNLVHIWKDMPFLSRVVASCLALMALGAIGVVIERLLFLTRTSAESKLFAEKVRVVLAKHDIEGVAKLAAAHPTSPLARLVHAGAAKYLDHTISPGHDNLGPIEAAKREMARRAEVISLELRRGMSLLASVGSLAPFVGLLGTVLGILGAFAKIGASGSAGLGAVSAGIAEALIETAFGLIVAIPSVGFFNWLNGKVEAIELDLTNANGEFLDEVERNHRDDDAAVDSGRAAA